MEEFKPIVIDGFRTDYDISNLGTIMRVKNSKTRKSGAILKGCFNKDGYAQVELHGTTMHRHRLIATAFLPNPNNLPEINHKNGIKSDYSLSNLEWCTSSENKLHAFKNGLSKRLTCENSRNHKLSNSDVEKNKRYAIFRR